MREPPARRPLVVTGSWLLTGAAMAALYWASDRVLGTGAARAVSDKVLHAGAYAVLAACWLAALRASWPAVAPVPLAWLAACAASLYGATDEWHQSFVVGRTADVWDWVADSAGAAAVALIVSAVTVVATRRRRAASRAT